MVAGVRLQLRGRGFVWQQNLGRLSFVKRLAAVSGSWNLSAAQCVDIIVVSAAAMHAKRHSSQI